MNEKDELSEILHYGDLPEEEIRWLLENGHEARLDTGEYFLREDSPAERFCVVLEGELQVTRTIDGQQVVLGTAPQGIMIGEFSLLQGSPSLISACAIVPSRLLVLDEGTFRELFCACPTFGSQVLQTAAERTQLSAVGLTQQAKMAALGKLSAGLAHELNNPAAAARRAAQSLLQSFPDIQAETMRLSALGLSEVQLQSLVAFQHDAIFSAATRRPLKPLEQSDREEEIGSWLNAQGVTQCWEMAPTFVAADLTLDDMKALVSQLPSHSAEVMLSWLKSALDAGTLLNDIEKSTERISEIVSAVKGYSYMDQAPEQNVDIHVGLENTLRVMRHRLRNIDVIREYDDDLPKITARGGELNQVWTNLIDNAVDALNGEGTIRLITRSENDFVMVEVTDDGPGIRPEVQDRLFEPFYTTKEVGAGTGLGLDITYRIIQAHSGTIEVQSQPGHTRFIVRLPIDNTGLTEDVEDA
jgi:signal transduction histidine kinase